MSSLNIVFAGTPEFGLPCLDALRTSEHHIKAVYSQPDRPAGRGRKLQASAVKQWALAHDIAVYQPLNFKTAEAIAELEALKPDVLVVIAYGLILPRAVLDVPRLGCINVHASLLPRWRGASPIQSAILHGDDETGVTIMNMDVGMDTGDMLEKAYCQISATDTASCVHDRLAHCSAQPLLTVLAQLSRNETLPQKQDNEAVTYASKINKEDALIQWQQSAVRINQMIRAFNPWPIAYIPLADEILRIHQAQVIEQQSRAQPGTILSMDKKGLLIATGEQCLLVEKIQFPGAKAITVADYINSGKTQLSLGMLL